MFSISTIPVFPQEASAAYLTSRKLQMSNSSTGATTASYAISFTVPTASANQARYVIVDFCTTAIIGSTCTAPTGLKVKTGASVAFTSGTWTSNWTQDTGVNAYSSSDNRLSLVNSGTATALLGVAQTVTINSATNPSSTGTFFARIYTYNSTTPNYSSASSIGTTVDYGVTAQSVVDTVTINAVVQEVLTFCIGGTASGSNNACPTNTSVTLSLGTGTPRVVGSTSNAAAVSQPFIPISPGPYTDTTQALYSYIETNALQWSSYKY
jgi:hypothetical protein